MNIKANDPKWIGNKYGKLTVIRPIHNGTRWLWECSCECGGTTIAQPQRLIKGLQNACHCGRRRFLHEYHYVHGDSKTRLYEIWAGMKKRCNNPAVKRYDRYGGRGIRYCPEWESYPEFKKWALASEYYDGGTLDRIDNDGDYTPENCKWSTLKEQAANRSSSIVIERDGEKHILSDWCKILGLTYSTVYCRIHRGIPPADALF